MQFTGITLVGLCEFLLNKRYIITCGILLFPGKNQNLAAGYKTYNLG